MTSSQPNSFAWSFWILADVRFIDLGLSIDLFHDLSNSFGIDFRQLIALNKPEWRSMQSQYFGYLDKINLGEGSTAQPGNRYIWHLDIVLLA